MKKYIFLSLVISTILTGCASVSPYGQGCRDGVNGIGLEKGSEKAIDQYCDGLEARKNLHEREGAGPHGRP